MFSLAAVVPMPAVCPIAVLCDPETNAERVSSPTPTWPVAVRVKFPEFVPRKVLFVP